MRSLQMNSFDLNMYRTYSFLTMDDSSFSSYSDISSSFTDDEEESMNETQKSVSDESEYEEESQKQENVKNQQNQNQNLFSINQNLISGVIEIPPLIQSKPIQSQNFGLISSSSARLPPLPPIDFLEIHQDLKTQVIDPFDIIPKTKTKVIDSQSSIDSSTKSVELFDWHTFQLPDVPDIDDTQILDTIHKQFEMSRLVEMMRNLK